jgi:ankyrin repeat protein
LLHGRGFELEQRNKKGFTPLLNAAFHRSTEVFQALVELGADVNAVDNAGFGALHSAAEQGAERIAEILIANDADLEAVTKDGRRPLEIAAAQEGTGVLDLLIKAGADIEARDESWGATALHVAAFHGRPKAVGRLLAAGANPDARSDLGSFPLSGAAKGPQALAECGNPAGHATLEGFTTAGMQPPDGGTAEDYTACVRILLEGGANPRAISAADGISAAHLAAGYNQVESLRLLLDKGAAIDQPTNSGETPLFGAAMAGAVEAIKLLIDRGARLAPLLGANTALHAAAAKGHEEVARILLEAEADPNFRNARSETPLHVAVMNNQPGMVRLLAKHGADLNAVNFHCSTPLHCAVTQDDPELIRALRKAGADPKRYDIDGVTAIRLARQHGKHRALAALLEPMEEASPPTTPDPESK